MKKLKQKLTTWILGKAKQGISAGPTSTHEVRMSEPININQWYQEIHYMNNQLKRQ